MNELKWSDGIGPRSREKRLLVVSAAGTPYWFAGGTDQNISVLSAHPVKDGKWSRTEYVLSIADGARVFPVSRGWESGKWREGFCAALGLPVHAQWSEIATALEVSESSLIGPKPGREGLCVIIPDGPTRTQSEID